MKTVRGLIGILFIVLVVLFAFNMESIKVDIYYWETKDNGELFWYNNFEAICIALFVVFIKGCHLIWTSNLRNPLLILASGSGCGSGGNRANLERVKNYRDSKMTFMTNEAAANEYKQTAWLDGMDSYSGKNAERAKDYLNSKLQFKDNESALNYIKGKK